MPDVTGLIKPLAQAPEAAAEFDAWILQQDIVPFLRANAKRDELIVDLTGSFVFMQGVFVPKANIEKAEPSDLVRWDLGGSSSWSIDVVLSGQHGKSVSIEEPLNDRSSSFFRNGEKLVFWRAFEGRQDQKQYCEILQKFAHIFELHFVSERNAYCRLDGRGDVEDVVRIIQIPERGEGWGTNGVTVKRELIDEYLAVTDSLFLLAFDFTRFRPRGFADWQELGKSEVFSECDLHYRRHVEPGHASYSRGSHVVRSKLSKDDIIAMRDFSVEKPREYASFIALDFKNKVLREVSTAPAAISNYFTKSELPFETSPAFFRPEVLLKYKSDSEKYRLEDRSISCRNSWHLQTYDINEAGQVHTYLCYLQRLPYEEQLYWKSYNEAPKAPISKRAFTTDFEGDWYTEYDPLRNLKDIIAELETSRVLWWTLRSADLASRVHYPVTTSPDEWSNEILNLDQLLVEGFETKWLRKKALDLKRTPDLRLQSLKLVEECLMGIGFEEDHARRVTAPMHGLHYLRSKLKGHASGDEATTIRRQLLADHGSYGKHFRALCAECDEALRTIAEQLKKL